MHLNAKMLNEAKDVIYNHSGLPDSVKEPVHIATKILFSLEFAYEDFLSREICGEVRRANPIISMIDVHGGDSSAFKAWFVRYEKPELIGEKENLILSEKNLAATPGVWGG